VTALADTSVFIVAEQGRVLAAPPPEHVAVSGVTVGELHADYDDVPGLRVVKL